MMVGHWNADENAALQGLSLEAQLIYLRGIRFYADANGIAGEKRRISERSLAEAVEFIPDRGSTSKPRYAKDMSRKYIRSKLDELERAGLIKNRGKLVFECLLAARNKSEQMRRGQCGAKEFEGGEGESRDDEETQKNQINQQIDENLEGMSGQMNGQMNGQENPPGGAHITSHQKIKTTAADPCVPARIARFSPSPDAFRMFVGWSPSPEFETAMGIYGTPRSDFPNEAYAAALMEFVLFWSAEEDTATQGSWEHKWVKSLLHLKAKLASRRNPNESRRPIPQQQRLSIVESANRAADQYIEQLAAERRAAQRVVGPG